MGSLRLPKLSSAREYSFTVSGIEVRFSVPSMSSKWGTQEVFRENFNLYDKNDYVRKDKDKTPFISCYITWWDVKGIPFFQENKGHISLYVSVSHWKGGGDLFRPSDMEAVLTELDESEYGDDNKCDKSVTTFLNWTPVVINGHPWLHYKIEEEAGRVSHQFLWIIPITDQHYLTFSFPTDHYRGRAEEVIEAMKNFCTQIMASVHITSPEWVLKLKAEAAEKWPDEQYSLTKEPLRWIREDLGRMSYGDYIAYMDKKNELTSDNEAETDKS
jgi:hypothetical protein|tara:strand:+ start:1457 stop:2272 length:816 start_codon:yes stop_codon:yes gene_type:complete